METVWLIRYGEIGLKGKNRYVFEDRLVSNIRRALELPEGAVWKRYGRVYARPDAADESIRERLATLPGVVSASPAVRVDKDILAICQAAVETMRRAIDRHPSARNAGLAFKVVARRSDKSFPFTSMELNQKLGSEVLKAFDGLKVDVHEPDITLYVEVREEGAYVYSEVFKGPGGLPVGVSGTGLLLLSGGLDSPVAGWMAMKRGMDVAGLHFHSYPFTTERSKQKVIDLATVLSRYAREMRLSVVHFTEVQTAIRKNCPDSLGITIMRRMMFRIAERIARRERIPALVTGESLSQVASQTIESIGVIEEVTTLPVLRPLIALDKEEIMARARAIGTYDLSILPYEDCCTVFVPKHPETKPTLSRVVAAERGLPIEELVERAVEKTERLVFRNGRSCAPIGASV